MPSKQPRADSSWVAQPGSQALFLGCPVYEVLYEGTRGPGKAQPTDEPVLTPTGFRPIGVLRVGDEILSPEGGVRRVTGVYPQGELDVFRVRFRDGAWTRASGDHLWQVHVSTAKCSPTRVLTTEQVAAEHRGVAVPLPDPMPQPEARLPVEPYLLGLFLGDGCWHGRAASISTWDPETAAHLVAAGFDAPPSSPNSFYARGPEGGAFRRALRRLGLDCGAAEKFVPELYLMASVDQRRALLQGLLDTDGCAGARDGHIEFSSASRGLSEAVVHLTRSLGGTASLHTNEARLDGERKLDRHRVHVGLPDAKSCFRLPRKRALALERPRNCGAMRRWVSSVQPDGRAECVCIRIDGPDGLYVTRDFVVTHNTDTLLMDYAQHVGRGHEDAWRGVMFRETHPQLSDVIAKSKRWYKAIFGEDGADYNESKSTWSFQGGEELLLRHMRTPDDYWSYHGHEYPWIGWEELTNWPSDSCYKVMMSCSRSSRRGMPRKYRATCNPYGRGHNWVKARWQLPQMRGRVIRTPGEPDRVAIHGHLDENLALLRADPEYITKIKAAARNPSELAAWLDGSWDIVAGGMFDDLWQPAFHLVPRFRVPRTWRVDRSLDWGSSRPFSVGWWARSDGSDLILPACEAKHGLPARDQRRMRTVEGDLFRVGEWYGWAQPVDEPVLTPGGWVPIGSLRPGDEVCSPDGGTERVEAVYPQGVKRVHRVRFHDGAETRACGDHLWRVHLVKRRGASQVLSTAAVASLLQSRRMAGSSDRVAVPLPAAASFPEAELPVDPYLLGLLLGDGCCTSDFSTWVSSFDEETLRHLESLGWTSTPSSPEKRYAVGDLGRALRASLGELGLQGLGSGEKFVPAAYLRGSVGQRWALLQGLMDTDGHVDANRYLGYTSTSRELAEDVVGLVRSLGGVASISTSSTYRRDSHRVYIRLAEAGRAFRLARKRELCVDRPLNRGVLRRFFEAVEDDGEAECVCIRVSHPDGLYITRDFVVTHNTGKPNEGLRMTPDAVAEGIRSREVQLGLGGRVMPGPADAAIFSAEPGEVSVAKQMEEAAGVRWLRAQKGPGSRKRGWEAVRGRLKQSPDPGRRLPGLFVVDDCGNFVRTFPTLPRSDNDPDDVDTQAEDHIGDEVRYRVAFTGGTIGRGTF